MTHLGGVLQINRILGLIYFNRVIWSKDLTLHAKRQMYID